MSSAPNSSRRTPVNTDRLQYAEAPVVRRRDRHAAPKVDASSLATVRELLKEIRRLEEEVNALDEDNEHLVSRMEDVLEENESLRRELGMRHAGGSSFPDGKPKWTPRANPRRTWEELEERESTTQATTRNRSAGQRSVKSSVSSGGRGLRYCEPDRDCSDSDYLDGTRKRSDSNQSATRKSSGSNHVVAFECNDEVISVPVMGVMRPSRSRVSTPFFSEDAVSKLTATTAPAAQLVQATSDDSEDDDSNTDRQSQVNFEPDVHVVEVPMGDSDETGSHHSRSVRGRIATPFIRDVPTREQPVAADEPAAI